MTPEKLACRTLCGMPHAANLATLACEHSPVQHDAREIEIRCDRTECQDGPPGLVERKLLRRSHQKNLRIGQQCRPDRLHHPSPLLNQGIGGAFYGAPEMF